MQLVLIAHGRGAARDHAESNGRLIIDIFADGNPIDESILDNPPADNAGINELRLQTTDPVAFLGETFASARESLALVREDQGTTAASLRTGELEPAIESLNAVLTGWQAIGEVVAQSAELVDIDLSTFTFKDKSANDCVQKLGDTLFEIRTNLTHQDWSALGDAVEYDLDELANDWNALLEALDAHVRAG